MKSPPPWCSTEFWQSTSARPNFFPKTLAPYRSGRNIPNLVFNEATALNTYDVLRADRILMDKASLGFINNFYGAKKAEPATA